MRGSRVRAYTHHAPDACPPSLAGYRRNQLRARFAIPGDEYEDYFAWLCCGPCTLCQETRTLSANNVEDGMWPAALGNGNGEKQPLIGGDIRSPFSSPKVV